MLRSDPSRKQRESMSTYQSYNSPALKPALSVIMKWILAPREYIYTRTKPCNSIGLTFSLFGTMPLIDARQHLPHSEDLLGMYSYIRSLAWGAPRWFCGVVNINSHLWKVTTHDESWCLHWADNVVYLLPRRQAGAIPSRPLNLNYKYIWAKKHTGRVIKLDCVKEQNAAFYPPAST